MKGGTLNMKKDTIYRVVMMSLTSKGQKCSTICVCHTVNHAELVVHGLSVSDKMHIYTIVESERE